MKNITELLGMGEYGVYVWSSFIVATVVILAMLIFTLRSLLQAKKTLKLLKKDEA